MDARVAPVESAESSSAAPHRARSRRPAWLAVALAAAAAAAFFAWRGFEAEKLPAGIAKSNGRIEAVRIDVAARLAGRVLEVRVREGDGVEAGEVLARMDTSTLEAERAQAEAERRQASHAVATAQAVVDQRAAELELARSTLARTEELVARGFVSAQKLDADRAQMLAARAVLVAAQSKVVESEASVASAQAAIRRVGAEIADAVLVAPRAGRVQYRLAEPGEVLAAGGKVVSLIDLDDVYMTVFLGEPVSGRLAIGAEARIVLDAAPEYVIPAKVSFVAAEAQFTPRTVETAEEREKLVFRVKAQVDPGLTRKHASRVKAGVPGVAYVRVDSRAPWPRSLEVKLPPSP